MWQNLSSAAVVIGALRVNSLASGWGSLEMLTVVRASKCHTDQGIRTFDSLPTGVVFWWPLQTVWTQIRPDKTSGLIWIKTVWHADGIPEQIFEEVDFDKNQQAPKKHAKLPSGQKLTLLAGVWNSLSGTRWPVEYKRPFQTRVSQ